MKTLIFTTVLFICALSTAQTNVISNKSHSGDIALLSQESDDFGMVYIPPTDSVILLNSTCVIEVKKRWDNNSYHDTICNNFYLPINQEEYKLFKANYPPMTKFIGFEKVKKNKKPRVNRFIQNKTSIFFGVIVLLILAYSAIPFYRKKV